MEEHCPLTSVAEVVELKVYWHNWEGVEPVLWDYDRNGRTRVLRWSKATGVMDDVGTEPPSEIDTEDMSRSDGEDEDNVENGLDSKDSVPDTLPESLSASETHIFDFEAAAPVSTANLEEVPDCRSSSS